MKTGDVRRFDFQSDVYRRQFRLLDDLGGGVWRCEYLAVEDGALEEMINDKYTSDSMIMDAIEKTGTTFEMRFVSTRAWAEMF